MNKYIIYRFIRLYEFRIMDMKNELFRFLMQENNL